MHWKDEKKWSIQEVVLCASLMYVNVSWGSSAWSEMIKSFSIQKSSNKPPNVFVVPALKSPTKQIFGHCSSSHNCLNLPRHAKNSSVLALLQYGRYTLIKRNSDFFKNTLKPIIEPSQFEKDEVLSFKSQQWCWPAKDGGQQNRRNPGAASYAATPLPPMEHFPISFGLFWKTWLASEFLYMWL